MRKNNFQTIDNYIGATNQYNIEMKRNSNVYVQLFHPVKTHRTVINELCKPRSSAKNECAQ